MATKEIGSMPYSLALRPSNPGDKNSEKKIYGQIQQRETIGLRTLASHISGHGSSFSVGTLQGVLSDMVDCTRELLKQGYSVDFEGLMRLYITVNSQGVDKVEDFDPAVHFTRVNLRGDVDADVQNFLNNNPEFEYVMTRDEQAAAKRAAKAALVVEGSSNSGGTTPGGGSQEQGSGNEEQESVAAPTISGTTPFEESTQVTMSGPADAEIRYTTDGSTPTSSSTLYSAAITLSVSTTVKAIAIKDGVSSQVTTKEFTKSNGGGGNPDFGDQG